MSPRETKGDFTVDLECTRTIDGLLWIGGNVTESTNSDAPAGARAAIVFKRGSPAEAIFVFQMNDPQPRLSEQREIDEEVEAMLAGGALD